MSTPAPRPGGPTLLPLQVCQRRLLAEWGLGMLPAFLMLVSQTVLGADGAIQDNYGQPAPEVWAWFSPLVMPTLLLILGVVGAQVHQPGAAHKRIERFYYRLAFTFAALYLGIINVLVIGVPLMGPAVGAGFLTHTSLFLGPLQGVVGASVGTLVVKAAET